MKIAVMQPYLFPYLGYFHLIDSVDAFVFYDDVNFIKGGWIHRNKIMARSGEFMFTVPLKKASSFNPINQTMINDSLYTAWRSKFFKSLKQAYGNAPHYEKIIALIESVFSDETPENVGVLAANSVKAVASYLGLQKQWYFSGDIFHDSINLKRAERLVAISRSLDAKVYVNASGGRALYSKDDFGAHGIDLKFINSNSIVYSRNGQETHAVLSIIDVLMYQEREQVKRMMKNYKVED